MDKKKKRTALIAAMTSVLLLTSGIVLAVVLNSDRRINTFHPAEQEIRIAENGGDPAETQDNSLVWEEKDEDNYFVPKTVEIGEFSDPNGEYLRVRFVPAWYDEAGCTVSGIEGITDIRTAELTEDTLLFKNGSASPATVVTLVLDEDWDELWEYDEVNQCFISKELIRSDDEIKLLSYVEISKTVLDAAEAEKISLRVDVLADSVQTEDDGTNPKW